MYLLRIIVKRKITKAEQKKKKKNEKKSIKTKNS